MTSDDAVPDHVPLPPEQPRPEAENSPESDEGSEALLGVDPPPAADPAAESVSPPHPDDEVPGPGPGAEWWRGDEVRDELRDTWHAEGGEVAAAAQEVGHQMQQAAGAISDAVAGAVYPAAQRRGLDIRWMRLSINLPALVLALLATWGGRTATDRMIHTIVTDGPFAPLGWVLFVVLLLGVLALTPIGSPLVQMLAGLVQGLAHGLVAAVRRGWRAPVIGYLLRLAVAWFVWAFIVGVLRVAGRGLIHWLTGA